MMWHWNSLWAPAPGDPPSITDPALWQSPWSAEQAIALQARSWEAMLSAAHSWWTMMLAAWPAGAAAWPVPTWNPTPLDRAAIAGAEPLQAKPPALVTDTPVNRPARKRSATARKR